MGSYGSLLERYVELHNEGDLDGVMDLYAEGKIVVDNLYHDNLSIDAQTRPPPATRLGHCVVTGGGRCQR